MNNTLETVIDSMLKENTGRHFLDSGGYYGRSWERNQDRDFEKEPSCRVDVDTDDDGNITSINVVYNIYHFLKNHLDTDEVTDALQAKFDEFNSREEYKKEAWENVMEAFCKEEKIKVSYSYYTYNIDTILSQDIVVAECETTDGEDFIFLRVHGGCDARGGFTAPRIFRASEYFNLAMNDVNVSCTGYTPELVAGEGALFNFPEKRCKNNWSLDGYFSNKELFKDIRYDEETKKFFCNACGGEIIFSVFEYY